MIPATIFQKLSDLPNRFIPVLSGVLMATVARFVCISVALPTVPVLQVAKPALQFLHFFPPVRDPPDPVEEHSANGHNGRDLREGVPGEHRERGSLELGLESELLEGDAREVEDGRPAHFFQPVDAVDVLARLGFHPFVGFLHQVLPVAELRRSGRAGLGARGLEALLDPARAEPALLDARIIARPFVRRDLEGARLDAVPAADALRLVIDDRAGGGFLKRPDRADGDAGRLEAMLAHPADVDTVVLFEGCVRGRRELFLFPSSQAVLLLAGVLAGIATDAHRQVYQHCFLPGHRTIPSRYWTARNSLSSRCHTASSMPASAPETGGPPSWRNTGCSSPPCPGAANRSRSR